MSNFESNSHIEILKTKLHKIWTAGDFGQIAKNLESEANRFVERLNLKAGLRVLDVACGTGNLALPAARIGADVVGVDIAENLIEQARANADKECLRIQFDVGDAENLAYEDESFDAVITMFGAMFAPRPEIVSAELKRVCRVGGKIAMANWTRTGFTGQMFKLNDKYLPSLMMPAPILWGDEEIAAERLKEGIADLKMTRRKIMFDFPFTPAETVEYFRTYFGPTQMAFNSLDEIRQTSLRHDLEELWTQNNQATDGTTKIESEYLEIIAERA